MRILEINRGLIYPHKNTNSYIKPKQKEYKNVSFTSNYSNGVYPPVFTKPIDKFNYFTAEEYNRLSQEELEKLRAEFNSMPNAESINSKAEKHLLIAKTLKYLLDKEYGEGNYVVISIGRSLASVCKTLSYKIGEENVKLIPMSEASRFYEHPINEISQDELDAFNEFLKSINLSKKEVEYSGKHYIIADCCRTKKSLNGAYRLFQSEKVWDNLPNVHKKDLIDSLYDVSEDEFNKLGIGDKWFFIDNFDFALMICLYKRYSPVNHCNSLAATKNAILTGKDYQTDNKYLWFKIMDNELGKDDKGSQLNP